MQLFGVLCVALLCEYAFALPANVAIPSIRVPDPSKDVDAGILQTEPLGHVEEQMPTEVVYDDKLNWRVVGGSNAEEGQFPYIVSLRSESTNSHFCGGSIISSSYVISAAHCTRGYLPSEIVVVANTTTLNSGGTRYLVALIVVHADHNPSTGENDISLLRTSTNINFGEFVSSIPIASGAVGGGLPAVLSGWGTTINGGSLPNNLQFVDLLTINNTDCAARHISTSRPIVDSQICTFTQSGEGACHGDSGGPLVVQNILVGLVSWGRPCAIGFPDVFTRVPSFVEWILENAV